MNAFFQLQEEQDRRDLSNTCRSSPAVLRVVSKHIHSFVFCRSRSYSFPRSHLNHILTLHIAPPKATKHPCGDQLRITVYPCFVNKRSFKKRWSSHLFRLPLFSSAVGRNLCVFSSRFFIGVYFFSSFAFCNCFWDISVCWNRWTPSAVWRRKKKVGYTATHVACGQWAVGSDEKGLSNP